MLWVSNKLHSMKYFRLKDKGKTYPHLKTLYTVLGRIARPSQFTNTQGTRRSDPTDSDNEQDVTEAMMDSEFGQAGGVISDELVSHIPLDCELCQMMILSKMFWMK